MAKTATEDTGRWTVFFAASAALVLSTLIAVLIGDRLTKVVPEHIIKIAAGALFVLFGILILKSAFAPRAAEAAVHAPAGPVARIVLRLAAGFEEAAAADYEALAAQADDPALAQLFSELARDEKRHLADLTAARTEHGSLAVGNVTLPKSDDRLKADASEHQRPVLAHALEHERATAGFYRELARDTAIPALRRVFAALAQEEDAHAQRLEAFAGVEGDA